MGLETRECWKIKESRGEGKSTERRKCDMSGPARKERKPSVRKTRLLLFKRV